MFIHFHICGNHSRLVDVIVVRHRAYACLRLVFLQEGHKPILKLGVTKSLEVRQTE